MLSNLSAVCSDVFIDVFIFMLFIDPNVLKRKRHKYGGETNPHPLQQLEDLEKLSKYQPLFCSAEFLSQAYLSENIVDKGIVKLIEMYCVMCQVSQ